MCVSNAYTTVTAVRLDGASETETTNTGGPFFEYRAEIGFTTETVRFRIKLDYATLPSQTQTTATTAQSTTAQSMATASTTTTSTTPLPLLHLRTLIVCRERKESWPLDWTSPN